jgi:hypothetical protein
MSSLGGVRSGATGREKLAYDPKGTNVEHAMGGPALFRTSTTYRTQTLANDS